MRVTIVVHGRFHAFDLARALQNIGHDVTVLTIQPPWKFEKFGLNRSQVRTNYIIGGLEKASRKLPETIRFTIEKLIKKRFSRWALKEVENAPQLPDVVYCFSGVAKELFEGLRNRQSLKFLARGSAHIEVQKMLLLHAMGLHLDVIPPAGPESYPHQWQVERELDEYQIADAIVVQSAFAEKSFKLKGRANVRRMVAASDTSHFHPTANAVRERAERIAAGSPLRVLTVGELSVRKGAFELIQVANQVSNSNFDFRFVGGVSKVCVRLKENNTKVNFFNRASHFDLVAHYDWADIFFFPTWEDGFAAVVAQAHSMGLPMLVSENCGGPDIMCCPDDGYLFNPGEPRIAIEALESWNSHRSDLVTIALAGAQRTHKRDWLDVARSFEDMVLKQHEAISPQ